MNVQASPFVVDFRGDASMAGLLAALEPHGSKALIIEYGGRVIRPGYHVTEVKAASFETLDCGGNPDQWRETILQVEDSGPDGETAFMSASKFRNILAQIGSKIALDPGARVTLEVGPPGEAMQVFDVSALMASGAGVILKLAGRSAICKPRHREASSNSAEGCCSQAKCC